MLACACVFFVFCGVCMIWMWGAAGEGCGGNKSSRAAFLHILLPAKVPRLVGRLTVFVYMFLFSSLVLFSGLLLFCSLVVCVFVAVCVMSCMCAGLCVCVFCVLWCVYDLDVGGGGGGLWRK